MSIKKRISAFKETSLMLLQEGKTVKQLEDVAEICKEEEQYEVVRGIILAITEFKANPQLKLL